ncbi:MAG TPA: TIR domain-containing protein [Pseudonocardiaceae bacterium]|nr:TIR domain-containing protein [Pseudonocardiaceae bacterium]
MGGVFINYRTIDDPLGAAAIHDRLVLRFGEDMVFRDCDSLQAGEHYPAAIWQALHNADVVVAVIGPRWLSLSDAAGVRLIERDHDWVRQELAFAFSAGIPVLPVLLKQTPADAVMPTVPELPLDIRQLARIQASEVGQRRLGADLERLITAITRVGRTPAVGVLRPAQQIFFDLVDALEQMPTMSSEHDRAAMIAQLPHHIASAVAYSPRRRTHAMNVLTACRGYPEGLSILVQVLRAIDGDDSIPLPHLADLVDQLRNH